MPPQYRQQDRCDSPHRRQQSLQHSTAPFGWSSFGTSSQQYQSQYSAYAPNAFGNMLGSFSLPQQQRHQLHSPWPSTPKQRCAWTSRPTTTYRVTAPPSSPTNSSFTTASTASDSSSSSTSPSLVEPSTHQPLSEWTSGRNSQWRTNLIDYCQKHDLPQPMYHTFSDKRGGRTAWSCGILIGTTIDVKARLWFDGKYIENAAEDAAELTLRHLQSL